MKSNRLKGFFQNEDLVYLVDSLARRYGVLPYEILTGQTIYEFNINSAIMLMAMNTEMKMRDPKRRLDGEPKTRRYRTLRDFGIKRTVLKKGKDA